MRRSGSRGRLYRNAAPVSRPACRACRAPASTCWSRSRWRFQCRECARSSRRRAQVRAFVVGHSHSFDAPIAAVTRADRRAATLAGADDHRTSTTLTISIARAGRKNSTPRRAAARSSTRPRTRSISSLARRRTRQGVRAVTGAWDAARPTEGAYAALTHFRRRCVRVVDL